MLFAFRALTVATMWMKDTPLALDMLFLDETGQVVWLGARTTPNSLAIVTTSQAVRYVLEINAIAFVFFAIAYAPWWFVQRRASSCQPSARRA